MPRKRIPQFTLTFLLYPSEDEPRKCVAHCLELDVLAVARTRPKAILLLKELITDLFVAAEEDDSVDQLFTPAPTKYWRRLATAQLYEPPPEVKRRHIEAFGVKSVDYAKAVL